MGLVSFQEAGLSGEEAEVPLDKRENETSADPQVSANNIDP